MFSVSFCFANVFLLLISCHNFVVEGIAVVVLQQVGHYVHIPGIAVVLDTHSMPVHCKYGFVGSFVDDLVADNLVADNFVDLVVVGPEVVPIVDLQLQHQLLFSCEAQLVYLQMKMKKQKVTIFICHRVIKIEDSR